MIERFAIVGNARSGTSMLRTSISNHPDCICYPEILIYNDNDRLKSHQKVFGNNDFFDKDGLTSIDKYLNKNLNTPQKPNGFKILLHDVSDWNMWNFFNEHNYKVILITRNYIAGYVSHLQGMQTGQFNIYNKEKIIPAESVDIDMEDFYIHLEFRMQNDLKILHKVKNLHVVRYQDLLLDYQSTVGQVFRFLGVKQNEVKPTTIKLNSKNFKERIKNYESFFKTLEAKYSYLKDDLI